MKLTFDAERLNKLFPFYVLVDRSMSIVSYGKSIAKGIAIKNGDSFFNLFKLRRPYLEDVSFDGLYTLKNQALLLDLVNGHSICFRGALEFFLEEGVVLFAINPWFASMEEVERHHLKLNDFALADPLIDLLHLLKTQEIVNEEVKDLLKTVKQQKRDLERLSLIVEESVNAVIITDCEGKIEWVNKAFERITGFNLSEVKQKIPSEILVGTSTSKETLAYLAKQVILKAPFVCEIINYKKSGSPFWARINGQPLYDQKKQHLGFFAIQEDITIEKEALLQVKENEERFKIALEKIGDNVWIYNFDTQQTELSKGISAMYLKTNNGLSNATPLQWLDMIHADDKQLLDRLGEAYLKKEITHHAIEYRICINNDEERWILDRGVVFETDAKGNPKKIIGTHTDITQLKQTENALEKQKAFYENILNKIPADIAVFDATHHYLFLNPVAVKNPEIRAWMIGKNDEEYLTYRNKPLKLGDKRRKLFNQAVSTQKLANYVEELLNQDGEIEYHLRNMYPVVNELGKVELVIGYGINITERIKIEKELEQAKRETEASIKAKETFLVNISHEIRTPMNGIMGITDLLVKTKLTEQQYEYTHLIQESSNNLVAIINDVLDFEKMNAGKLELESIPFNLSKKLKSTIDTFRYRAEEKNLYIHFDNNLPNELWVEGDQFRLNQIMTNLIGNAIKFTERGGVTVSVVLVKLTKNNIQLQISITDTGIGISKEHLSKIFNPYIQAKVDISRKYGGTGLGLSICKKLVTLQKGDIKVISEEKKGTTFTLLLPYKKAIAQIAEKLTPESYQNIKGKYILIAEDVEINQYVLKNMLELWGCRTYIANNGKKALQAVLENEFDLVLMDIQMPEMNGFEATTAIRNLADSNKSNIPIVAVTANSLQGITEQYNISGMNDYLIKPYNEAALFKVVDNIFNTEYSKIVKENAYSLFSEDNWTISFKSVSGGDMIFEKKLAEICLRTVPQIFDQLHISSIKEDWENVAQCAHKFTSSIGVFQLTKVNKHIKLIEQNAKSRTELSKMPDYILKLKKMLEKIYEELKNTYNIK